MSEAVAPDIFDIEAVCPRPRRFLVALAFALTLYGLFWLGWHFFAVDAMIPGVLFVGSFAVPVSATVLFCEFNIRRNVPLRDVVLVVLLGGVLSLILAVALLYFDNSLFSILSVPEDWHDCMRAPIEEIAKVVVAVAVARKVSYRYVLNGLLFGAAVGAGFASFESAGYALVQCLNSIASSVADGAADAGAMLGRAVSEAEDAIVARGLLSPFSHVAWSALACAGLWWARCCRSRVMAFVNWRFLLLFGVASALHMAWNAPFEPPCYSKQIMLGVIAWVAILVVLRKGVGQIKEEQEAILGRVS